MESIWWIIKQIDEKKLLTTLIEQEDTLSKKSDKFIDKLDKDSFAKGVQVGMIVNTSYDIKVNKNKNCACCVKNNFDYFSLLVSFSLF